jgi:cytidine deaminase
MSAGRDPLVAAARAACERAHAPYSGIHVGAAVRSSSGAVYRGANVENAAYPLGNCAETSAIAAGVAAEGAEFRIAEIAAWATDNAGHGVACSPCGGCRQRIQELAVDEHVNVHFPWQGGETRTARIGDLLPFAFSLPAASRNK